MHTILQDLRFTLRQLRSAPSFAITTILTLALGIGCATAVFSVIDATLLRPLPFAHQGEIVVPETLAIAGFHQPWSLPSYLDARQQLDTFSALAGYSTFARVNLEGPSGPVSLPAVKSTDNFFTVFGVKPLLGRTYLPGEDQPGRDDVAVLSYEVWQREFSSQTDVVGKVVRLDGKPFTILGVMPAGFRFPLQTIHAIYIPLHADPFYISCRACHWMETVGLLKPGVTLERSQANFNETFTNLARSYPASDTGRTVHVLPLQVSINKQAGAPLKTLGFAALALLSIACVNVAGLLLARGVKREREMALRAAVGAGRARIIRQMITESLALSAAGLGLGMAIAWLLLAAMRTFLISALARGIDVHLNLPALGVALLLSGLTSLAASMAPALRLSGTDPVLALRSGVSTGPSRSQHRLRSSFIVMQVALSMVLLSVAGLLLRNLASMLTTELGYPAEKILTTQVTLSPASYAGKDPIATLYQPLLDRVSHMPGVQAAGFINVLPIQNFGSNRDTHITGQPPYPPRLDVTAETRYVTPGYFDAMGIHLVRGRMLTEGLDPWQNPAGTVVVNEAFQRKFFSSGGDPVGAHIDDNDKAELKTTIVGKVTDIRQDFRQPPMAEMDYLATEFPPKDRIQMLPSMTLVVRSSGDPGQLIAPIRDALHQIDPTIPFQTPETMAQVVRDSLVFDRMENWLFGIFAGFALLLSLVGLYGLIQHEVTLRRRDIGLRIALGSTRLRVVVEVIQRVTLLMAGGIAMGWGLTLALQRILGSVVEMHAAHDAALLSGLTLALALAGIAASLLPATQAATIDPMHALRSE
ncbi:duplicated orphan permease [Bryocella elongata]|uniref:Duplicated orphan permease n=1 Tax=Bryocella elongata TaxID=863522 RepID=A0A1H5Z3S2_9BACT|nr:ABC transporter permease [Bryocella elongata]SEG30968.1 duplicated orphan permease [Bryocella elongata]